MARNEKADFQRRYIPSIEGIRGYGFLVVFLAHYFGPEQFATSGRIFFYPSLIESAIGTFAVPGFFAISGYLIGGILYDSRGKEGFFKVFYSRRILRVFPLYYLTLLAITFLDLFRGVPLDYHFWAHYIYLQNLLPGYATQHGPPTIQVIHFWSLAVEEQFYFLWPLVVWLFPARRKLLGITWALIAMSFILRIASPWLHLTNEQVYLSTPTRVDAILLGVVLAIIRHDKIYERIVPIAKYFAFGGLSIAAVRAVWTGSAWSFDYLDITLMFPCVDITCVALVVAAMEKDSWLNRVCSERWVCCLGKVSYALYVFHFTYFMWFQRTLIPGLTRHMPHTIAVFVSGSIALSLTVTLAALSYRFLEGPIANYKRQLKYGPLKRSHIGEDSAADALAEAG
jgi:peptidoglycan/LPS O-acetylase OafA/YrhL